MEQQLKQLTTDCSQLSHRAAFLEHLGRFLSSSSGRHEWLAWLLYYSLPVLKDVLPAAYYANWALLVDCVVVMLGIDISLAQLVYCERGFKTFVLDFQKLYGKQHMSFNVHQTLHLVQSVKDWGPLWCHSAFLFESFNAVLLNMVKGTQGVPMQILHTFYLICAIPSNLKSVLQRCSVSQRIFIQSLTTHQRHIRSAVKLSTGLTVLGLPHYRSLNRSHFVALHSLSAIVKQTVVAYYRRAVVHGEIVDTLHYCRRLKWNSYTVSLDNGRYFQVTTFVVTDLGYWKVLAPGPIQLCQQLSNHSTETEARHCSF